MGLALLLAVILGLNALYVRTGYPRTLNGTGKYFELPERIEAANLGNSYSMYAFDWSLCKNVVGVDLSLQAQTHRYDYAILCQYFDRFEEGALLAVAASPYSMYVKDLKEEDIEVIETRYYCFLEREYQPDYSLWYDMQYRVVPVVNAKPKHLYRAFFLPPERWDSNAETLSAYSITNWTEAQQLERARSRADYMLPQCLPAEERAQYGSLENILKKAAEKRLRVVLVTPPTTPYFFDAFSSVYYDAFQSDMTELLAAYPDVIWLNYTGDPRFDDFNLYLDTDHLNILGSAVFMKAFADDLLPHGVDLGMA